jgi:hypothetical protein
MEFLVGTGRDHPLRAAHPGEPVKEFFTLRLYTKSALNWLKLGEGDIAQIPDPTAPVPQARERP